MSDSDYSDDESLSSLNLGDGNIPYDSDFDSDFDDNESLSSLGIGSFYNGGKKSKSNKKNTKQTKKSNKLSRVDDINNNDTNTNNEDDEEEEFDEDDANENLLKDDDIISDNDSNIDSDSDSDKETTEINDDDKDDDILTDNDTDLETETKNKIEVIPVNYNHPIVIDKKNRISRPYLTKYEYVRCLGERTQQITAGAKVMIKNADELLKFKSPEDIAKLEIKEKCCPYIIIRPLPNNKEEHWDINELEILFPII